MTESLFKFFLKALNFKRASDAGAMNFAKLLRTLFDTKSLGGCFS